MTERKERLSEDLKVVKKSNDSYKEQVGEALSFGEKYKKEGEEMKNEFWNKYSLQEFDVLILQYEESREKFEELLLPEERKILDALDDSTREKFFNDYLGDRILYSGNIGNLKRNRLDRSEWHCAGMGDLRKFEELSSSIKHRFQIGMFIDLRGNEIGDEGVEILSKEWRNCLKLGMFIDLRGNEIGAAGAEAISKIELKEGVTLDLSRNDIGSAGAEALSKMELKEGVELYLMHNNIGSAGAEALSKMELKEGVWLNLHDNHIGDEGAEALSKMELKEGVGLALGYNDIGDEGAEALSKMELKKGVILDLAMNHIGDDGVEAIMRNMELKEGVILDLARNNVSEAMKQKLKEWVQSYKDRGINCEVRV